MKPVILIGIGLLLSVRVPAQTNVDSLKGILQTAPADTNRILTLLQIGNYYEYVNLDSSERYYRQALQLSKELKTPFYEGKTISWCTDVLNQKGALEEALALNLRGLEIGKQLGHRRLTVASLANVANSYQFLADYDKTLEYQLAALPMVEKMDNPVYLSSLLNNISMTYQMLKQYPKALPYAERAVNIAEENQDAYGSAAAASSLGIIYNNQGDHLKALSYFQRALQVSEENGFMDTQALALLNICEQYRHNDESAKGLPYALKGIPIAEEVGVQETLARLYHSAGACCFDLYRYREAEPLLEKAIELSGRFKFRENLKETYLAASDVELALGHDATAAGYRKAYTALRDSLINESILQHTTEMETRYKTAQKEAEIGRLEAQSEVQQLRLQQRQGIIVGLGITLGLLGGFGFMYVQNTRNKQRITHQQIELGEQKILQLEQEKQLSAVDAMLRGQEEERGRLARDLHDGLGGMLSGVRQTLNVVKGNQYIPEASANSFNRALEMLDSSISELRRVARNMMPEALLKFGLKDAVEDLCHNFSGPSLKVQYQAFGLENRLPESTEVIVFRIVQELLNNVVKHAGADQVLLQLLRDGNRFHLTIEDNGRGFDPKKLEEAAGIGWINIRSRVNYLGGEMDLRSAPGKGTSVEIEFMIKQDNKDERAH